MVMENQTRWCGRPLNANWYLHTSSGSSPNPFPFGLPCDIPVWGDFDGDGKADYNPDLSKKIADGDFGDPYRGRVQSGWILMARSGQTYGISGTVVMAEEDLEDKVISDHVMRIEPKPDAALKPSYLLTALSHPLLGWPLVKARAYGSSIPEIEVADMEAFGIVRLKATEESAIAELAEASAKARAAADVMEREMATDAPTIIDKFIAR